MTLAHRILIVLAGLAGAIGVALSAMAAHVGGGAMLATAASFLILHAGASVAAVSLALRAEGRSANVFTVAAAAMLLGAALFSGDVALRALAETKLLWGTAPWGGSLAILGWLGVAIGGLTARRADAR